MEGWKKKEKTNWKVISCACTTQETHGDHWRFDIVLNSELSWYFKTSAHKIIRLHRFDVKVCVIDFFLADLGPNEKNLL